MQRKATSPLQMILRVVAPPPGVVFAVQRGRDALLPPCDSAAELLSFAITLDVGPTSTSGALDFRGPYAQGTPADRFVYLNSGKRAGQPDTPWERRAKLKLADIPRDLVEAAADDPDCALEGRLPGTMRDGGPVCATVPHDAISWRLLRRSPRPGHVDPR